MIKRKDILVIAAVLLVALLAYGIMLITRQGQTAGETVNIYAGAALYQTVSLGENQTVRVEQADGAVNEVVIEDGTVRMGYSSCANQLCVHQGTLTPENWVHRSMGRSIICLPNQVVIELALNPEHPSMQMDDVADI